MYRNIVENSSMINNDELVFYTNKELPPVFGYLEHRVTLSRLVSQVEIDEGLDVHFRGDSCDEKVPEITLFLDAHHQVMDEIRMMLTALPERKEADVLVQMIAYNFYDCMSGGCPHFLSGVLAVMCVTRKVDRNTRVYPKPSSVSGSDDWYTVGDFLDDMERRGAIKDILFLHEKIARVDGNLSLLSSPKGSCSVVEGSELCGELGTAL